MTFFHTQSGIALNFSDFLVTFSFQLSAFGFYDSQDITTITETIELKTFYQIMFISMQNMGGFLFLKYWQ